MNYRLHDESAVCGKMKQAIAKKNLYFIAADMDFDAVL